MIEEPVVDIVVFEIAGTRYAADLTQVRRIDSLGTGDSFAYPFGAPREQKRSLVFGSPEGGERRLAIDAVLGVRAVRVAELRRMPPAVAAPSVSIGAWIDGEDTVLLVDLAALTPSSPRS